MLANEEKFQPTYQQLSNLVGMLGMPDLEIGVVRLLLKVNYEYSQASGRCMINKQTQLLEHASASAGVVLVEYLDLLELLMGYQILSTTDVGRSAVLDTLFQAELPEIGAVQKAAFFLRYIVRLPNVKLDVRNKITENLLWFLNYPDNEVLTESLSALSSLTYGHGINLDHYKVLIQRLIQLL